MRARPSVLDAPSNLGLRPPGDGLVPGCYKLAGALRDHRLLERIDATDGGCVTPPRYDRSGWNPGDGVFNAAAIAAYSVQLADRVDGLLSAGAFPVVLGGDCSILLGPALALRRRGRYGLAFLDAHSDFRHPENTPAAELGAAAGEDLALVTGRGQADLTSLAGWGPYLADSDVAVLGTRPDDRYLSELRRLGLPVWESARLGPAEDVAGATAEVLAHLNRNDLAGFWIHVDADILDPSVLPAVDSPTPGGLAHADLAALLGGLVGAPQCMGLEFTIYDPDLDPDGDHAAALTDTLVEALTTS
jgi:arginase